MHPRDYMYIYYFESAIAQQQKGIQKFYETYAPLKVKNEKYEMLFCYLGACSNILLANKWRAKIGVCTVQTDERKKDITEKYGFEFKN